MAFPQPSTEPVILRVLRKSADPGFTSKRDDHVTKGKHPFGAVAARALTDFADIPAESTGPQAPNHEERAGHEEDRHRVKLRDLARQ